MNILDIICAVTNIQKKVILSDIRTKDVVQARHVAMWMLHRSGLSHAKCGDILNRERSTVIHGVNKINNFISINDNIICTLIKQIDDYQEEFIYEI